MCHDATIKMALCHVECATMPQSKWHCATFKSCGPRLRSPQRATSHNLSVVRNPHFIFKSATFLCSDERAQQLDQGRSGGSQGLPDLKIPESFLACALAHAACRADHSVRCTASRASPTSWPASAR